VKVVVAALSASSPAVLALRAEGLDIEVVVMKDDYDYAKMMKRLWLAAEPFVLVEHDVVPWPGAIRALEDCPEPCCSYPYPLGEQGEVWQALGCIKFGREPLSNTGVAERLDGVLWHNVDSVILPTLGRNGKSHPHRHEPPVAHVRSKK
jgi:hypothetical protein